MDFFICATGALLVFISLANILQYIDEFFEEREAEKQWRLTPSKLLYGAFVFKTLGYATLGMGGLKLILMVLNVGSFC